MSHAVRAGVERVRGDEASAVAEPAPAAEPVYEGLVTRAIAFALDAALINLVAIVVAGTVSLICPFCICRTSSRTC